MRALLLISLTSGCIEWNVRGRDDLVTEPVVVDEVFEQDSPPKVDILWVVANDRSMADEHDALADAFATFAEDLSSVKLAWQVGVVTTDVSGPDAGVLQGDPWVITPQAADPEQALADAADVGTDGAAPEAGLGAAWLALTDPLASTENRGFRREDAGLHVVFVSDSDDASTSVLGLDPSAAFLRFLDAEAERSGQATVVSALVGPLPDGCTGAIGQATAAATYTAVAEATGGTVGSICDSDLEPILRSIATASQDWPDTFVLQATPVPDTLRVSIDGTRQDDGWTLDLDLPAVVFQTAPPPGSSIAVRYEVDEP